MRRPVVGVPPGTTNVTVEHGRIGAALVLDDEGASTRLVERLSRGERLRGAVGAVADDLPGDDRPGHVARMAVPAGRSPGSERGLLRDDLRRLKEPDRDHPEPRGDSRMQVEPFADVGHACCGEPHQERRELVGGVLRGAPGDACRRRGRSGVECQLALQGSEREDDRGLPLARRCDRNCGRDERAAQDEKNGQLLQRVPPICRGCNLVHAFEPSSDAARLRSWPAAREPARGPAPGWPGRASR